MDKLSKDIIGIIRKYLTIFKRDVDRNHKLVYKQIHRISDLNYYYKTSLISVIKTTDPEIFFYCKFCDKISYCFTNYIYTLDTAFQEIEKNTKYCSVDRTCNDCYQTCRIKFSVLNQLIMIFR